MLKRSFALCLILIVKVLTVFAQYEDKISVTTPSPNNIAGTTRLPVNYYQGIPSISLPLYTLESTELSVPVAINYQATGVKLHQYASVVGINWNLQAGGSITRVVRGRPDESDSGYIGANRTGLNINGGNEVDPTRSDRISSGEWDGEPDLFFITTPYESNSFIFDQNKQIVFTQPSKLKLTMTPVAGTNNYLNVSWSAIDGNGHRYSFGTTSSSKEAVYDGISYVSTWLLDEVRNFNKTDIITFEYVTGQNIATNKYIKTRVLFTVSGACTSDPESISVNPYASTYVAPKYLSKIISTTGKVEFGYVDDRQDLTNAKRLAYIDISNNSGYLKRIAFRHHYFGTPDPNKDLNRLGLQDVYVVGQNHTSSMKLYSFNYFNNPANKFPARNSVAIDHWGYYNNNTDATPFPPQALKVPDLEKTKQYTLYEIEYGLGGKTTYEYELNDYWEASVSANRMSGGLRLKSISETDNTGKATTQQFSYRDETNPTRSTGQIYIVNFVYNNSVSHLIVIPPASSCSINGESWYNTLFFNTYDMNAPLGYSRVKVINQDGGSEVYKFTNHSTYSDEEKMVNANFGYVYSINAMRQFGYLTSYAHRRGKLLFRQLFNAAGVKVHETEYQYTALTAPVKVARGISITLEFFSNVNTRRWYHNIYYHIKDNFQITKQIERVYDTQNSSLAQEQEQTYEYSSDGSLLRKINYSNSNGASYATKYYYPENRAEIAGLSTDDNTSYQQMDGLSIKVREEKILPSAQKEISHSSYKTFNGGGTPAVIKVFPSSTQKSRYGGPFIEQSKRAYDFATGNLQTEQGIDGIPQTYLYNSLREKIATVVNAAPDEVHFQDFEENTSAVSGEGATGTRYWSGSLQVSFIKPNLKNYFLSYSRLVSGKWEPVRTAYTNNMTIPGTYPIDNVTVLPEDAFITSYISIPNVGVTAETEPNGKSAFHEYDEFQRIRVTKDKDKKVVKLYEYSSACNCPLPVVYASLIFRNPYTNDITEDYFGYEVEVVVTFKDSNGNPLQVNGLPFSVKETLDEGVNITENTYNYTANGTEYSLGRKYLTEEYYRGGQLHSYLYRLYLLLPSTQFIIQ